MLAKVNPAGFLTATAPFSSLSRRHKMGAQLGTPLEAMPGTISAQQSSLSQLSHSSSLWQDADMSPTISKAAFLSHDPCVHPAPCSAAVNTSAAHPVAPCDPASPAAFPGTFPHPTPNPNPGARLQPSTADQHIVLHLACWESGLSAMP